MVSFKVIKVSHIMQNICRILPLKRIHLNLETIEIQLYSYEKLFVINYIEKN